MQEAAGDTKRRDIGRVRQTWLCQHVEVDPFSPTPIESVESPGPQPTCREFSPSAAPLDSNDWQERPSEERPSETPDSYEAYLVDAIAEQTFRMSELAYLDGIQPTDLPLSVLQALNHLSSLQAQTQEYANRLFGSPGDHAEHPLPPYPFAEVELSWPSKTPHVWGIYKPSDNRKQSKGSARKSARGGQPTPKRR